ncbi:helix-turn-helix transcriptional regulator [Flavobacterium sp.]|uniref:helix-turn-helix transcriptional regulator n=1 Tax=Flavobacterium sp. TaxID=239 RepID=UPI0025C6D406|nr:helix-turn-helix transcriptional regulator [Flavobacterium sp.]
MKKKLLQARLNKGLSQEELADLIGISQSNYSRREKGLKKISNIEWVKIAKCLDVAKEEIYESDNLNTIETNDSLKAESFVIPKFIIEHIEMLTEKNKQLEEKLKKYEL